MRVICIDNDNIENQLTDGGSYDVKQNTLSKSLYTVVNDFGSRQHLGRRRFITIAENRYMKIGNILK